MPRRPQWPPPMREHKSSGQARVRIWQDGRILERYLGPYGSDEAKQAYARFLAELTANGGRLPAPSTDPKTATVADLVAQFFTHADQHYRKPDGSPKTELASFRHALKPLQELYSELAGQEFAPRHLKSLQRHMVTLGWCRRVINRNTTRIRTVWRWLESEGLVPDGRWNALRSVRGLEPGQAPDHGDVLPVPEADLAATLPQLGSVPRAIAETQLLTGARPGEILVLRPVDLLRAESVDLGRGLKLEAKGCWVVLPENHKTAHRGHKRILLFGPKAQAVLAPFLSGRDASASLFNPREAMEIYLHSVGRTVGQELAHFGDRYKIDSYEQAIKRACRRAGVPEWHPNQLRHNAATRLVAEYGWEVARIVLGHRAVAVTQIYALPDLTKAVEAIKEAG